MITVNSATRAIRYSYGDEFYLEATIKNHTTQQGETFHFAVRSTSSPIALVDILATTEVTQQGNIKCVFSKSNLNELTVGNYIYDVYAKGNDKQTFMFTAQFVVEAVAHNA